MRLFRSAHTQVEFSFAGMFLPRRNTSLTNVIPLTWRGCSAVEPLEFRSTVSNRFGSDENVFYAVAAFDPRVGELYF